MTLNGYSEDTFGYNQTIKNGELPDANDVKGVVPPIGAIIPWAKTFQATSETNSGTTTATTANKLVDTGGTPNFVATISIGQVIHNTTDDTFTYVTAVDSNSVLSVNNDIFISGENYTIYKTPFLSDAWAECDGTVLSDSDSPYNGATLPDMNSTQGFARGNISSGGTGGGDNTTLTVANLAAHTHGLVGDSGAGSGIKKTGGGGSFATNSTGSGTSFTNLPVYYEIVWIIRVK